MAKMDEIVKTTPPLGFELSPEQLSTLASSVTEDNEIAKYMRALDDLDRERKQRRILFYCKLIFLATAAIGCGWKYAELCHRQGLL